MDASTELPITQELVTSLTQLLMSEEENPDSSTIFTPKLASIVYATIGTIGVLGNGLTVLVMCSSKKLRGKLTNMYIINQSILDAVVSVLIIAISNLNSEIPYTGLTAEWYCLGWQSRAFVWGLMASSTFNLIALTLERYAEVVHPIWHKLNFTKTKAVLSMVAIWLIGPLWEGAGKIPSTHIVNGKCSLYSKWPTEAGRRAYGINVVIFKLIVPLIILVYAYGRIAYILSKKIKVARNKQAVAPQGMQQNSAQPAAGTGGRLQRGMRNTIKTLAIVAVVFVLCWAWNQIYFLMFNVGYPADFQSNFYHFSVIGCYINAIVNPFIYAVKYEQFQVAARALFCRCLGGAPTNRVDLSVTGASTVHAVS